MDFGDLLLLIFIVSGLLSALAGRKKKKTTGRVPAQRPQRRPRPRPRPRPGAAGGTSGPRRELPQSEPSVDPSGGGGGPVPSQMEEILRQLGLDVGVEEEAPEVRIEVAPPPSPPPPPVVMQEEPRAVSLEGQSLETMDGDTAQRHEKFHQKYVKPLDPIDSRRRSSRAGIRLNPTSLREAIILHEILGPPKGLQ